MGPPGMAPGMGMGGAAPPMPGGGPPPTPGAAGPPAVGGANPAHTAAQWHANVNDRNEGPISYDQLQLWVHAKVLMPGSLIWNPSMENWEPAEKILPELFGGGGVSSSNDGDEEEETSMARGDLVELALELSRPSPWLIGAAVALFLAAIVLIVGQSAPLINPRLGTRTIEFLRPLLGIALGGILITVGVMLLIYNSKLKQLLAEPNLENTLVASQSLGNLWITIGISGVVWISLLVILLVFGFGTGADVMRMIR